MKTILLTILTAFLLCPLYSAQTYEIPKGASYDSSKEKLSQQLMKDLGVQNGGFIWEIRRDRIYVDLKNFYHDEDEISFRVEHEKGNIVYLPIAKLGTTGLGYFIPFESVRGWRARELKELYPELATCINRYANSVDSEYGHICEPKNINFLPDAFFHLKDDIYLSVLVPECCELTKNEDGLRVYQDDEYWQDSTKRFQDKVFIFQVSKSEKNGFLESVQSLLFHDYILSQESIYKESIVSETSELLYGNGLLSTIETKWHLKGGYMLTFVDIFADMGDGMEYHVIYSVYSAQESGKREEGDYIDVDKLIHFFRDNNVKILRANQ